MTVMCAEFVSSVVEGDPVARERYLAMNEPIFARVARQTLSADYPGWELDDARQVARITAIEQAEFISGAAGFAGYLFVTALRAALRERGLYHRGYPLRAACDERPVAVEPDELAEDAATTPSAEGDFLRAEERRQVRALVNALPPLPRRVVRLRHGFDGGEPRAQRETAAALGMGRSAVRWHEARAHALLREQMEDYSWTT